MARHREQLGRAVPERQGVLSGGHWLIQGSESLYSPPNSATLHSLVQKRVSNARALGSTPCTCWYRTASQHQPAGS
jgi:hypothetical protein